MNFGNILESYFPSYQTFFLLQLKTFFNFSAKAESLLSSEKNSVKKFFSQFTEKIPGQNVIKAAEMFSAAGTKFKINQQYQLAAEAFEKSAKTYQAVDDQFGQVQVNWRIFLYLLKSFLKPL